MSLITCRQAISLDGYTAGPGQNLDNPIGRDGMRLMQWQFAATEPGNEQDAAVLKETQWEANVGAYIMGRNMFSPGRGAWDPAWRGWWGENPPYHVPVFVLTHHEREPLPMAGGTSFTFVTDGMESALAQAKQVVTGDQKIAIAGGASTVRQFLTAGLLDELWLHITPLTLGAGERLFDGVGSIDLDPVRVVASPRVTHIQYRIRH